MWWVPIVAALASTAAGAGLNKLLTPEPGKPKQPGQGLGTIAQANQGLGQQQQGLMSDDILMQYLAQSGARKAV